MSCCDTVPALALAKGNEQVAEAYISRPHPPTPSVLCTVPKAREVRVVNHLNFPFGMHARAPPAFPVSRTKLPRGAVQVYPLLPALFLPLAPRLQAASSREILHMQASQCGNQMGTKS
jgi:hypothetical protein